MARIPRLRGRLIALAAIVALVTPVAGAAPTLAGSPILGGIEIEIPTGNRISGTVENGNGDPIGGMSVSACTLDEDCGSDALTAGDGTFTIRGLLPDTYALFFAPVDPSDYLNGWYSSGGPVDAIGDATPIDATAGDVAGIAVVAATGLSISGTVTGARGAPLAGVDVSASGDSDGGSAETDASGDYTIRGLLDGSYRLSLRVPPTLNFRSGSVVDGGVVEEDFGGDFIDLAGADATGVDIVSPAGLRITGTLTGPGAVGATVSASGTENSDAVTIGADGFWAIRGLWPGTYQLAFSPEQDGFLESFFPLGYWSGGPTLTSDPDAAAEIDLSSSSKTGLNAAVPDGLSISGTVLGDDGSPLEDAYVYICGLSVGCASGVTDAAGDWRFDHIRPDSYLVHVWEGNHVGGLFGSGGYAIDAAHAKRVVVSTADVTGVDVVLPAGAIITGHVGGPLGEDIEGAYVNALGTGGISPGNPGGDRTAADGSFALRGLTEDDYVISVGFDPYTDYIRGYYDDAAPDGYTDDYDLATMITVGDAATGTSYVAVPPTRVVDSRVGLGVPGIFTADVPRTFWVAGVPPIPVHAVAVTGNVTVVNQTAAGYVSLTPTPTASPTSSTINVPFGDVRANNFTVPLDGFGRLSAVFKAAAGKKAHVIVDVTGYFVEDDAHGTYSTITPARILDSRSGIGLSGRFLANAPKTLSVAGAHGIPADAVAVTANLTVVGQTRAGYLSVTPTPVANPTTSTLNFPLGDARANGLTARLNGQGDLSIVYKASGGSTDVLLDVTGYYRNAPSGLLFYPLRPGRVIDTRPGVLASELVGQISANTPRTAGMVGHAAIPLDASAVTGNLTIVGQTSAGFVSITPTPVPSPLTSTINFPLGDTRANGVTVPLNGPGQLSIVFKAANGQKTHATLDVTGYFR